MKILIAVLLLSGIGLVLGLMLAFASKAFAVPTDEKTEAIRDALPGANCGGCGYSGCDGYAAALSKGEAEPNLCTAGGADTAQKLSEVLGVEVTAIKKYSVIACNKCNAASEFNYDGAASCAAAALLNGGPIACKSGCIGFGDCVSVCEFNAIKVENGHAVICEDICTGCGKCVKVCPKGIIKPVEAKKVAFVNCSNTQKGAVARKNCTAACIGCKKCQTVCEFNAITVENNLATVNRELCTGCGKCAASCPQKCISLLR